ncbi:transcription factor CP2-like [Liolophura sinensis]|uniref:transcription factor CP2-like n=1 Tax=Liolophura sinensis TaxID=3198878 RepID=UPI0031587712
MSHLAGTSNTSSSLSSVLSSTASTCTISAWDIDGGLAADFDGSLSGLGSELGTSSYNMSEALLALPVFKQENLENGFQYVLGAATSPAVKLNEETLTYLNQGQSYEIKVKKLGDLSDFQGKLLRSVIKILFHERRLQYMEKEQLDFWKQIRPGERILDLDVPLSYGLIDARNDSNALNSAEFVWDPTKESGVYIKVNCISTEFTAKKHGGEKGVPFRLQIETFLHGDSSKLQHCASCQLKVFKPKGADRKHKTDREKMEKRSESEKEKYQPSYECTVLTEMSPEQFYQPATPTNSVSSSGSFSSLSKQPGSFSSTEMDDGSTNGTSTLLPSPVCSTPSPSPSLSVRSPAHIDVVSPPPSRTGPLPLCASAPEVIQWLQQNRFASFTRVFQNFSGADLLRLNRDDLIQICGLADGIRLFNALQHKSVRPRLTIYVSQESEVVYHAIYLESLQSRELILKLAQLYNIRPEHILDIYIQGPSGIHILVTDDVVVNIQDESRLVVEGLKDESNDHYRLLLKAVE